MTDLAADYAGLESFADSLGNARINFDSSRQTAADFTGSAGSAAVETALTDFTQRWNLGRQTIDSYFDVLIRMVNGAVQTLRQTDKDLAGLPPTGQP